MMGHACFGTYEQAQTGAMQGVYPQLTTALPLARARS